jgi:hypothetical protein
MLRGYDDQRMDNVRIVVDDLEAAKAWNLASAVEIVDVHPHLVRPAATGNLLRPRGNVGHLGGGLDGLRAQRRSEQVCTT